MGRLLACAIALGSASAVGNLPPPRAAVCQADSECVITRFSGCCQSCGCGRGPYAISAKELKRSEGRCAAMDCATPRDCPPSACAVPEPESSFRAVCVNGACEAARVQCRSDSDCMIAYPTPPCAPGSACGCCPGTIPQAVPAEGERPRVVKEHSGSQSAKDAVKFGLSPAPSPNAQRPDPPSCSPCRGPTPAQAKCAAGRCVIAPIRPRPPG